MPLSIDLPEPHQWYLAEYSCFVLIEQTWKAPDDNHCYLVYLYFRLAPVDETGEFTEGQHERVRGIGMICLPDPIRRQPLGPELNLDNQGSHLLVTGVVLEKNVAEIAIHPLPPSAPVPRG